MTSLSRDFKKHKKLIIGIPMTTRIDQQVYQEKLNLVRYFASTDDALII